VIYVEDDAALAGLLEYGLRAHGYRFAAYRNGREALRELLALDVQGTHPLLLLDVDLPALDGYSIFDALQRQRPAPTAWSSPPCTEPRKSNCAASKRGRSTIW